MYKHIERHPHTYRQTHKHPPTGTYTSRHKHIERTAEVGPGKKRQKRNINKLTKSIPREAKACYDKTR
jgi:hypothetical protein